MYRNQLQLQNPEASYTADQDHQRAALRSRTRRAQAIAIDVAALRRQGVEPVPAFFGIAEQYVSGALSSEQFIAAIEGLWHRPAPVPIRSSPQPASD
jgi:predicted DsbA family dithiol-disulfide isomerase